MSLNPLSGPLRHAGSTALGVTLLFFSAVIGAVWVSIAAVQWLQTRLGFSLGALVVGLVFIAPLLLYLLVRAASRVEKEEAPAAEASDADAALTLVLHRMQDFVRDRPALSVAVTALLGVMIARFPGAAHFILTTLKQHTDAPSA